MLSKEYFDSLPPGWSGPETVQDLYNLALTVEAGRSILEIGSFSGRSAININLATQGKCEIVSIDALDEVLALGYLIGDTVPKLPYGADKWQRGLTLAQNFEFFTQAHCNIRRVPENYPPQTTVVVKAKMIYLDSCRNYTRTLTQLKYALTNHLADDGFLCGSHYFDGYGSELKRAVQDFAAQENLSLVNYASGIWTLHRRTQ